MRHGFSSKATPIVWIRSLSSSSNFQPLPHSYREYKSQMQERRQWWPPLEIKQWERARVTSQIINPALNFCFCFVPWWETSVLAATVPRQLYRLQTPSPRAKDVLQQYLSCRFKENLPFLVHEVHEHLINSVCAEAHYNYKCKLEGWMLFVLLYHFLSLFTLQIWLIFHVVQRRTLLYYHSKDSGASWLK